MLHDLAMTETNKVSFVSCWFKATVIVYLAGALLGFLNAGEQGLAWQLGAGIVRAPIAGLVIGLIWWGVKR